MGIFRKITNPVTHSDDLAKSIDYQKKLEKEYSELYSVVISEATDLYNIRKDSVKRIKKMERYVTKLKNCPQYILSEAEKAVKDTEEMNRAIIEEASRKKLDEDKSEQSNKGKIIGGVGASAGAATAVLGPSAAMAIATTFGTAGTGVAIGSLSGVAATNAALAWLGGGTLAAGGAGIAGGSTVLALLGPIGWGLAGVTVIGGTLLSANANKKRIAELKVLHQTFEENIAILRASRNKLEVLINYTSKLRLKIDISPFNNVESNYKSLDYPRELLQGLASDSILLSKVIQERIN